MYLVGIDIGGTGIKAGIVKENGEILFKQSIPTDKEAPYTLLAKQIADLVFDMVKRSGISMDEILSVGMGIPGDVDDKNGIVVCAENINIDGSPICEEVGKYIQKPIYIGNDANCAALGEYYVLNDKEIKHFVLVTFGTGVGSGIILDGKLFTGFNGSGGEAGHMVIVSGGYECNCGRKGCWEMYASATALVRDTLSAAKSNPDSLVCEMIKANGGKANGTIVWDAMKQGDTVAKEVIDKYITYVGEGIVNLINIFQPEVLAIGGGVSNAGDALLIPIKTIVKEKSYGIKRDTNVVLARLGNDAGIVGAAFLGK